MSLTGEVMGGEGAVLADQITRARIAGAAGHRVILVEGVSDQRAVAALAEKQDRNLLDERTAVIPIAGATNVGRFVDLLGPAGYDVPLVGLCDEAEEAEFSAALSKAGIHVDVSGSWVSSTIFVCRADLEEELIRALGTEAMLDLIETQGQIRRFRSFQNQPDQRHKTTEAQLWRWLGNHKIRYAPLMVGALDLDKVPGPLLGVMATV